MSVGVSTTSKNTSRNIERQFTAGIIQDPSFFHHYPRALEIFSDPVAKSAFNAVGKILKLNPQATKGAISLDLIADAMSRNGVPKATTDMLQKEIIAPFGGEIVDLQFNYKYLFELYLKRTAQPTWNKWQQKADVGLMTNAEAAEENARELAELERNELDTAISYDQFDGAAEAEKTRQLIASGRIATLPTDLPDLHEEVKLMDCGLIIILGDTGGGKSILAKKLAKWLVERHGRRVRYLSSELSIKQMIYRDICSFHPKLRYPDLMMGKWDEICETARKQHPSGGMMFWDTMQSRPIESLLAQAKREDADLVLDVFDDAGLVDAKSEATQIKKSLQLARDYATKNGRLVIATVQSDKMSRISARAGEGMTATAAKGSGSIEDKSSVFLTIKSRKAKRAMAIKYHDGVHYIKRDGILPIRYIELSKNTFGEAGAKQPVWALGPNFDFENIPDDWRAACQENWDAAGDK